MVMFDGQNDEGVVAGLWWCLMDSDEGVVAGLWWCLMDIVMREWLLVCGGV